MALVMISCPARHPSHAVPISVKLPEWAQSLLLKAMFGVSLASVYHCHTEQDVCCVAWCAQAMITSTHQVVDLMSSIIPRHELGPYSTCDTRCRPNSSEVSRCVCPLSITTVHHSSCSEMFWYCTLLYPTGTWSPMEVKVIRTRFPCSTHPHDTHVSSSAHTTATAVSEAQPSDAPRSLSECITCSSPGGGSSSGGCSHTNEGLPTTTVSDAARSLVRTADGPPGVSPADVRWSGTSLLLPCGNGSTLEILEVRKRKPRCPWFWSKA